MKKLILAAFTAITISFNSFADKIFIDSAVGPEDFYIGETNLATWLQNSGGGGGHGDDTGLRQVLNYETETIPLNYEERDGELWVTETLRSAEEGEPLIIPAYHDGKVVRGIAYNADLDCEAETMIFWGTELEPGKDEEYEYEQDGETYTDTRIVKPVFPGAMSTVILPNVKEIPNEYFSNFTELTRVYAPNVVKIGRGAFKESSIENIDFPNAHIIETEAFIGTLATNVSLPLVEEIPGGVFDNGLQSVYLPSVKRIKGQVTADNTQCYPFDEMEYLSLPNCEEISGPVFGENSKLKHINAPKLKRMGPKNLFPSLESIEFPQCREWQSVVQNNKHLESIILGAEALPIRAFQNCTNLRRVTLPNLINGGKQAFEGCYNLETVSAQKMINGGVKMFKDCPHLIRVDIPNCENIEDRMFENCDNIYNVRGDGGDYGETPVVNAPKVKRIGKHAFKNVDKRDDNLIGAIFLQGMDPRDVASVDGKTIYVGTYGNGIWKSIDYGQSWTRLVAEFSYGSGISVSTENIIFATDCDDSFQYKSIDGGNTWNYLFHNQNGLYSVGTYDGTNVFFSSDYSILRSTDGGLSYGTVMDSDHGIITDIAVYKNNVFATAGEDGIIVYSSDNGNTWNSIGTSYAMYGIALTENEIFVTWSDWGIKKCNLQTFLDDPYNTEWEDYYDFSDDGFEFNGMDCSRDGKYLFVTTKDNRLFRICNGEAKQISFSDVVFYDSGSISTLNGKTIYRIDDDSDYLYKSEDGGLNWERFYDKVADHVVDSYDGVYYSYDNQLFKNAAGEEVSSFQNSIEGLAVAKDGSVIYTFDGPYLHRSYDKGRSWTTLNAPSDDFISITLAKDGTLFVGLGNSTIYKSTDGGNNWEEIIDDQKSYSIMGINKDLLYFISQSGDALFKAERKDGEWRYVTVLENPPFFKVAIGPDDIIYGNSDGSAIYKYQVGREAKGNIGVINLPTLENIDTGAFENQTHLKSIQIPRCEVIGPTAFKNCGSADLGIYKSPEKTHDIGLLGATLLKSKAINDITISHDGQIIYVTEANDGNIWKSIDAGIHWNKSESPSGDGGSRIATYDGNTVYITCDNASGELYRSRDGGNSWDNIGGIGLDYPWSAIDIYENFIIAADSNGGIYRSMNGGDSWQFSFQDSSELTPSDIYIMDSETVYAAYSDDRLYKSSDGGINWSRIFPANQVDYQGVIALENGDVYTTDDGHIGLFVQSNGSSRQLVPNCPMQKYGLGLDLSPDGNIIYVVDASYNMWKYHINSQIWEQTAFQLNDSRDIDDIASLDGKVLYTANGSCCDSLSKSIDAGKTWDFYSSGYTFSHVAVIKVDNNDIIYSCEANNLIKISDGNVEYLTDGSIIQDNIIAIAVKKDNSKVYISTDDYRLYVYDVSTRNLTNITPSNSHTEIYNISIVNDDVYVCVREDRFLKSSDNGQTWEEIDPLSGRARVLTIDGNTFYYKTDECQFLYKYVLSENKDYDAIEGPLGNVFGCFYIWSIDPSNIIHIVDEGNNIWEYDANQIQASETDINYGTDFDPDYGPEVQLIEKCNFNNIRRIEDRAFANTGLGQMKFNYNENGPDGEGWYLKKWIPLDINLPTGLYVASNAFDNAQRLGEIIMPDLGGGGGGGGGEINEKLKQALEYETASENITYEERDGELWVTGIQGTSETLVIPAYNDGKRVRGISKDADLSGNATTLVFWGTEIEATRTGNTQHYDMERPAWPQNLETLIIPNVKTIPVACFDGVGIKTLYAPNLENVGVDAFQNTLLESIQLPKLHYAEARAFCGTPATNAIVPELVEMAGDMFGCQLAELYAPKVKIVHGLSGQAYKQTGGRESCFRNIRILKLPECESIGPNCFDDTCITEYIKAPKLKSIAKDNWLVNIKVINFPECIDWQASVVKQQPHPRMRHAQQDDFLDNTNLVRICLGVDFLKDNAFRRCKNLQVVYLPNATKGGRWAFADCDNLMNVYAPKLKDGAWGMFQNCINLGYVDIRSCETIGGEMFSGCDKIMYLRGNKPDSAQYDTEYSQYSANFDLSTWEKEVYQFATVYAPKVKTIGKYAFNGNIEREEKLIGDIFLQGIQVNDVASADGRIVYAATQNGLWKSIDGGNSWLKLTNALQSSYNSVATSDGNIVYTVNDSYIDKSEDGGNTWNQVYSGSYFKSIDTFDGTNVYAVVAYSIYRTTNGGLSWSEMSKRSNYAMNDITVYETNIYIVDDYYTYISHDNGNSWSTISTGAKGIAASKKGIYRARNNYSIQWSINGGNNWQTYGNTTLPITSYRRIGCSKDGVFLYIPSGNSTDLYQLKYVAQGDGGPSVAKTKRKKLAFSSAVFETIYGSIATLDGKTIYTIDGGNDDLKVSHDYGITWSNLNVAANTISLAYHRNTGSVGESKDEILYWASSRDVYRKRENEQAQTIWSESNSIRCMEVAKDDSVIYIATSDNHVYRSYNQGASWGQISGIGYCSCLYIYKDILYYSDGNYVYKYDGESISQLFSRADSRYLLVLDENTIYACDDEAELCKYNYDAGVWKQTWLGINFRDITLGPDNIIFAINADGNRIEKYQPKNGSYSRLKVIDLPSVERIGYGAFENQYYLQTILIPNCEIINDSAFKNCNRRALSYGEYEVAYDTNRVYPIHHPDFSNVKYIGSRAFANAGFGRMRFGSAYEVDHIVYYLGEWVGEDINLLSAIYVATNAFQGAREINSIIMPELGGGSVDSTITINGDTQYVSNNPSFTLDIPADLSDNTISINGSAQTLSSNPSFTGIATESWVTGYVSTNHQSLDGYATENWVSEQGYLTDSSLDGYATEDWTKSYDGRVEKEVGIHESSNQTIQISFDNLNEQFFKKLDGSSGIFYLSLPDATKYYSGKISIYAQELPSFNFYYDFIDSNITSLPHEKPWLNVEDDSLWKFEFSSIPDTTLWFYDRSTEYKYSNIITYEWTVDNGVVRDVSPEPFGKLEIPAVINGQTITAIGPGAFSDCDNLVTVYIPSTVVNIDSSAFADCDMLQEIITIPATMSSRRMLAASDSGSQLRNIGYQAFSNCTRLVSIPDTSVITNVGPSAFYGCESLTNISLPDSVTHIGSSAFNYCINLETVELSDNLQYVDECVFQDCESLTEIVVPDSVTSIGDYAFSGCVALTNINLGTGVESINNNAFNGCEELTTITIPNSIDTIQSYAFNNCSSLNEITIPNGVRNIDYGVFAGCSSLTNIDLGNSITNINDKAFENCSNLKEITLPQSVKSIGNDAFSGCTQLVDIIVPADSESYSTVDGVLFSKDMTTLINYPTSKSNYTYRIPDTVTTIKKLAFQNCENLGEVIFPEGINNIVSNSFENCNNIANVEVNQYILQRKMKSLFPFYYGVTNVTIKDGVTTINNQAFDGCYRMLDVSMPNSITSIESGAFRNCKSLQYIDIPDSVTSIYLMDIEPFQSCTNLRSIRVSQAVMNEGGVSQVFRSSCSTITNIVISTNVNNIQTGSFDGCRQVQQITVPKYIAENKNLSSFLPSYNSSLQTIIFDDSVSEIKSYMCSYSSLKNVIIPDSVRRIREYAFNGCYSLTNIVIGKGITNIFGSAFSECEYVQSITYSHKDTETIDEGLLGIKSLFRDRGIDVDSSSITWTDLNTNTYAWGFSWGYVTGIRPEYSGSLTIPQEINGELVDYIYSYAFDGQTNITEIILPEYIDSIGEYAFNNCTALTNVILPESLGWIYDDAFDNCTNLQSLTIPQYLCNISLTNSFQHYTQYLPSRIVLHDSVTNLSTKTFAGCDFITELDLGNGLSSISNSLFKNFTNLQSVVFGNNVKSIGNDAFDGCHNLQKINLSNVKTIGQYAFRNCYNLENVELNNITNIASSVFANSGITNLIINNNCSIGNTVFIGCTNLLNAKVLTDHIGSGMFQNCNSLTNVVLLNNISYIADNAFSNCYNLMSINLSDNLITIGNNAFDSCAGLQNIYIGNSVTNIGSYAFNNCTNISNVIVTATNLSIRQHAFNNCNGLNEVNIQDLQSWCNTKFEHEFSNPTTYSKHLYLNNEEICGDYVIPDNITNIGDYAFYGIPITNLYISDSVKSTGYKAFYGCPIENIRVVQGCNDCFNHATNIIIGNNVSNLLYISGEALDSTYSIDVESNNTTFASSDDVLFFKDMTALVYYPGQKPSTYVVPEHVILINGDAFRSNLKDITITNQSLILGNALIGHHLTNAIIGVENITYAAFSNATIDSITLTDGVKNIDCYAFSRLQTEKNVIIPGSVTNIDSHAFHWAFMKSLTLHDGLQNICSRAFYWTKFESMTDLVIPNTVTNIGESAFETYDGQGAGGNPARIHGTLTIPDNVINIDARAFAYQSFNQLIIGNGLTNVGNYAFYKCPIRTAYYRCLDNESYEDAYDRITSLLSNAQLSAELIDTSPVYDWEIDQVGTIVSAAEPANFNVVSLPIPQIVSNQIVTSLGDDILTNKNIRKITIPSTVTNIGCRVFENCTNLETVVLETPNIQMIGTNTFNGCNNLGEVHYIYGSAETHESAELRIQTLFENAGANTNNITFIDKTIEYTFTIDGNGVITSASPVDTNSIGHVNVPNEINEIPVVSLSSNLFKNHSNIESISLPTNLVKISENAFEQCYNLKSIILPENVTCLNSNAFNSCEKLQYVIISGNITNSYSTAWVYPPGVSGSSRIPFAYCNNVKTVILNNNGTTPNNLFYGNYGPQNVIFGNNITNIGATFTSVKTLTNVMFLSNTNKIVINKDAFASTPLQNIEIPQTVVTIGESAFGGSKLKSIDIPSSVKTLGKNAFNNCKDLTDVAGGSGLTSIGDMAFDGDGALTNIVIGNAGGYDMFLYCTNLESATITGGTQVGQYCFRGCSKLKSLTLADSITTIKDAGLDGISVTNLILPDKLKILERRAFMNCTNLVSISISTNITSIGDAIFLNCNALTTIKYIRKTNETPDNALTRVRNLFNGKIDTDSITFIDITPEEVSILNTNKQKYYNKIYEFAQAVVTRKRKLLDAA